VIAHQAIAEQADGDAGQPFGQNLFKGRKIRLLAENPQAAVGAVEHMIHQTARTCSFGSAHNVKL